MWHIAPRSSGRAHFLERVSFSNTREMIRCGPVRIAGTQDGTGASRKDERSSSAVAGKASTFLTHPSKRHWVAPPETGKIFLGSRGSVVLSGGISGGNMGCHAYYGMRRQVQ